MSVNHVRLSGSIINDDTLLEILNLPILVVLDEAYIEFSGLESRLRWVKKFENLIVLRTFSKRAGIFLSLCEELSIIIKLGHSKTCIAQFMVKLQIFRWF